MNRTELRPLLLALATLVAGTAVAVLIATLFQGSARVAVAPGSASVSGMPNGGSDWRSEYQIWVCGERQPNAPMWESGVHTHGDGFIHIHPFIPSEEGRGARLVKWFEYGGGKLTSDEMRIPGSARTHKNGDRCPDGAAGTIQVSVNNQKLADWSEYIPQDGDFIRIDFGADSATND